MANDKTLQGLKKLAKQYQMQDNALFISLINQYALQQRVIENIKNAIDEEDSLIATKEYVKGRENIYANPLVKELPKHSDSANKTANTIIDLIVRLGKEKPKKSKLEDLLNG